MQNFDPKLFENQNSPIRKQPNTASDRAVKRSERPDEGRRSRKKFKLDDKKSRSRDAKESELSKTDLPSAFSLASRGALKDSTEKDSEDSEQDETTVVEDNVSKEKSPKDDQPKVVNPLTSELEDVKADVRAEAATKSAKAARTQLEEMFKTLVDSITQMKLDGKNETTVLIKHPPLFANAKLTLTTFDTAKGEFNITFSELNAKAKSILDLQVTKDALMRQLEEKGYVMHIFVATTEKEEGLLTAAETNPREDRQREQKEGEEEREQKEQR